MNRIRNVGGALAVLGIVSVLALMSTLPASAGPGGLSGLYGGTLRVGVLGSISLNPFTATDADSWRVIPLVYDSIARIDPGSLEPTPWAAASWTVEGTYLNVTLRSDLRFHDGSALSAADVLYSYTQYRTRGMVPSDLTVTGSGATASFHSSTGGGLLYGSGTTLPIVKSGTSANPVGSGPFMPPASVSMPLTLTANTAHFRPPYLDSVTFSRYTNLTSAAVALLSSPRSLDFIGWPLEIDDPGTIVNVSGANKTLVSDANVVQSPSSTHFVTGFNMRSGRPTSNDLVRMALAKTSSPLLGTQVFVTARASRSPIIQEDTPWYNPEVPTYQVVTTEYPSPTAILTESLELLDRANFVDRDGDGFRENAAGGQLTLTAVGIPLAENTRIFTLQVAAVDIFSRLGLRVNLESEPSATLLSRLASGNWDIFLASMPGELDPGFLREYFYTGGAMNYAGISDATLNSYLANADAALDMASRQSFVDAAQLWIMNKAFFVPQIHFNAIEATVRGAFEGWVSIPGGVNNFWTYMNVHVAQVGQLTATLTLVPVALKSGEATTAVAKVTDQDGNGVQGAAVSLRIGGTQVASGSTGPGGTVSLSLTAPAVGGFTDIEVVMQATSVGYDGATASASMTVHPDIEALSVAVTASKVTAASGEDVTVTATVTAGGSPEAGVRVTFEVVGIGGSVSTASGTTNAQGVVTTTFSGDVGPRTQFRILATASASGFTDATGSTTVVVEQRVGSIEPRGIPGLDLYAIVIAVIAIVVIAALAFWWVRRK